MRKPIYYCKTCRKRIAEKNYPLHDRKNHEIQERKRVPSKL